MQRALKKNWLCHTVRFSPMMGGNRIILFSYNVYFIEFTQSDDIIMGHWTSASKRHSQSTVLSLQASSSFILLSNYILWNVIKMSNFVAMREMRSTSSSLSYRLKLLLCGLKSFCDGIEGNFSIINSLIVLQMHYHRTLWKWHSKCSNEIF